MERQEKKPATMLDESFIEQLLQNEQMERILEAKDRSAAGPTAPAHGLTMIGLIYE